MDEKSSRKSYKLILSPSYDPTKISRRTRVRWHKIGKKQEPDITGNAQDVSSASAAGGSNESNTTLPNSQVAASNDIYFVFPDVSKENDNSRTNSLLNDGDNFERTPGTSSNATGVPYESIERMSDEDCDITQDEPMIEDTCYDESDKDDETCTESESNDSSNTSCSEVNSDNSDSSDSSADEPKYRFNADALQGKTIMFPEAHETVSNVLLMLTSYSIAKNLTHRNEDDLVDLIKVLAGPSFKSWNATHYARSKVFNPPRDKMILHYYCETENCHKIIASRNLADKASQIQVECNNCKVQYNLSAESPNQFMSIDIKYQLELFLDDETMQTDVLETIEKIKQTPNDGLIRDIYDSHLYKKIQRLSPGALTYNVNTDGAPMFKSSNRSFWPIQLHINELSSRKRIHTVMLGGLFVTFKEPKPEFMKLYLSTFMDQAEDLMNNGVNFTLKTTGEKKNFKFYCLLLCMDTVARPVVQFRLQFNGHYGCSWCYAYGSHDGRAMRYPLTKDDPAVRTHETHCQDVANVEIAGKTVNGVKGRSELLRWNHFDMVWGLPIDYMHGVLLGVTKHMWTIWTSPATQDYLQPRHRDEIDYRRSNIKRPQEIHRLVRSIKYAPKWKASEWESWLLLDSAPCLEGILNETYFESYLLFVKSINTLMKCEISEKDIRTCEYNLLKFVGECQILYGEHVMTFNLHSMLHLGESVRRSGPLWGSSTFPFENGIFYFKRNINAPHGVSHQIANNFLKKKSVQANIDNTATTLACREYCHNLFKPTSLANSIKSMNGVTLIGVGRINENLRDLMMKHVHILYTPIEEFDRCIYDGTVLRSIAYKRPKKTDDTTVQLKSKKIMKIHSFVLVNQMCYLLGKEIIITASNFNGNVTLDHIFEVCNDHGPEIIVEADCIENKVIHFGTGIKSYIGFFPKLMGI